MKSSRRKSTRRSPSTEETRPEQPERSESAVAPSTAGSTAAVSPSIPECREAKTLLFSTAANGKPAIRLTYPTTLEDLKALKSLVSRLPWPSPPLVDVMFRDEKHVELTVDVSGFRVVNVTYEIVVD